MGRWLDQRPRHVALLELLNLQNLAWQANGGKACVLQVVEDMLDDRLSRRGERLLMRNQRVLAVARAARHRVHVGFRRQGMILAFAGRLVTASATMLVTGLGGGMIVTVTAMAISRAQINRDRTVAGHAHVQRPARPREGLGGDERRYKEGSSHNDCGTWAKLNAQDYRLLSVQGPRVNQEIGAIAVRKCLHCCHLAVISAVTAAAPPRRARSCRPAEVPGAFGRSDSIGPAPSEMRDSSESRSAEP